MALSELYGPIETVVDKLTDFDSVHRDGLVASIVTAIEETLCPPEPTGNKLPLPPLVTAGGWCAPTSQTYNLFGSGSGFPAPGPVVIDSLDELRELDDADLRRWSRATRQLLTILGIPLDRFNQVLAAVILNEEL